MWRITLNLALLLLPSSIFLLLNRSFFSLVNPTWGDMVAMPTLPLELKHFFYLFNDIYNYGVGVVYIPHIIFSQLTRFLTHSMTQFIYIFSVLIILQISFLDLAKRLGITSKKFCLTAISYSSLLTIMIGLSNVFLTNYIQGAIDVYVAYFLALPITAYMYVLFNKPTVSTAAIIALLSVVASWYGQLSLIYICLFLIPYVLLFFFTKTASFKKTLLYLMITLLLVAISNSPTLYQDYIFVSSALRNISKVQVTSFVGSTTGMYERIDVLNALLFSGNNGDISRSLYNINEFGENLSSKASLAVLFLQLLPIGLLLLLKRKTSQLDILLYGCLGIFLAYIGLLAAFDAPPIGFLLKSTPLLSLFRNPKKLILSAYVSFMLLFLIAPLFLSIKRRYYFLSLIFIIICNVSASHKFIFDGYMGLVKSLDNGDISSYNEKAIKDQYNFPDRYFSLKNQIGGEKIIVVPNNSQSLYTNHLRYLYRPFIISENNAIWGSLESPNDFSLTLYNKLIGKEFDSFSRTMSSLGIRYLLIDKKSPWYLYTGNPQPDTRYFYGTYTIGSPAEYEKLLSKQRSLKKIYDDDKFIIYESIYAVTSPIYVSQNPCIKSSQLGNGCDAVVPLSAYNAVLNSPAKIHIQKTDSTDPTNMRTIVQVTSPGKVVMIFNKIYFPQWQLKSKDISHAAISKTVANGYETAWVINFPKAGNFELNLYFKGQQLYFILSIISLISIVCIITLILL